MKIVHIITGLSVGGAEMMLLRLAEQLRGRFEQHIISLTDAGLVANKLESMGLSVTALGITSELPNPLAVFQLSAQIRKLRPDVVQTWMYHADLFGSIAARLAGVRAVAWNIRNNDLSVDNTKLRTRLVVYSLARLSQNLPTRIVCCSYRAMQTHINLGYAPKRIVVIPNGFDLSRFNIDFSARADVRNELRIPENIPLVGLIARFDPQKNHEGFFIAAERLHRVRPDVHFLLAGRGVERENLQLMGWVRQSGLETVTHLLGERQDVPRLTAALDIASCTSSFGEAFPNVLGEAMACGVACVSTDAGDAALIVGDAGRIVPRGDMAALAMAWEELLALPAMERMAIGGRARNRVAENFEVGAVADRYAAFYENMVRGVK